MNMGEVKKAAREYIAAHGLKRARLFALDAVHAGREDERVVRELERLTQKWRREGHL